MKRAISSADLVRILESARLSMSTERAAQDDIERALMGAQFPYEREVRLSRGDIIDFVCERIGIEVKIKGSKRAILRQVERYADSEALDEIILLTGVAMGMPVAINGRPVYVVSMGRAWL